MGYFSYKLVRSGAHCVVSLFAHISIKGFIEWEEKAVSSRSPHNCSAWLSLAYLCLSSWVLCLCLGSVTVMQMRDFMLLASPENTCGRTHGRLGLVDSACPACTKPWAPSSALHELSITVHDCQPAAHEVEAGGSGFHHHPWLQ